MKTTSDHHGYQIEILTATKDYFWNKGKVYKSRKVAMAMVGKIVCGVDDGKINIPEFRYCKIVEWFA